MWFLFLIYPMCSIAVLDMLNCKYVNNRWWLAKDLDTVCPLYNQGAFQFSWTIICSFGFPFGIPLIMLWSLRHFGLPKMARYKSLGLSVFLNWYQHILKCYREKTERKALSAMLLKFQVTIMCFAALRARLDLDHLSHSSSNFCFDLTGRP